MRKWIITACVAGQLVVLAYMVYGREVVIHTGTRIVIATAPIDPRDPFRGDYVRLRYGLNSLQYAPSRWQTADYEPRKGDRVYAILESRPGGLHDVSYFTDAVPGDESASAPLFLKGRIRQVQPGVRTTGAGTTGAGTTGADLTFGIEQLFVEQGSGLSIEERRGTRGGLQTAMHAAIAVGTDGTAVLTGHSWNSLAIGIDVTSSFPLTGPEAQVSGPEIQAPGVERPAVLIPDTGEASPEQPPAPLILTIANVSDRNITLNNPGSNCGFRLEAAAAAASDYVEPDGVCAGLAAEPVTLAPDQLLVIDIDLADPRWHMSLPVDGVVRTADVRSFTDNIEAFRLVYRSAHVPDRIPSAVDRPESAVFWQGVLVSQSFSSQGQMD